MVPGLSDPMADSSALVSADEGAEVEKAAREARRGRQCDDVDVCLAALWNEQGAEPKEEAQPLETSDEEDRVEKKKSLPLGEASIERRRKRRREQKK